MRIPVDVSAVFERAKWAILHINEEIDGAGEGMGNRTATIEIGFEDPRDIHFVQTEVSDLFYREVRPGDKITLGRIRCDFKRA